MQLPQKNLSLTDRMIRGGVSLAMIVFAVFWADQIGDIFLQLVIIIFAVLNLISFITGWCPVYKLASISTYKNKQV
ncbi:DUF2892 domain-containing protein [Glaciecola sp. SC05]|uniref:YgaP family membrane protein n=1 Tax=Glaciecola sp. SC05 TaxID=1987355 RepID=UPI003526EC44